MIPQYIHQVIEKLEEHKFVAHLVGGCVRDLLMGKMPDDWDITTNAKPEEVLVIFPEAKYENNFGTVILPIRENTDLLTVLEITTYRSEYGYLDKRHPDKIIFETELEKDLSRRDFTINAIAYHPGQDEYIDLFGGQKDIKKKIIRTVGEPSDRFKEDALRMLRAIRFSSQLGFSLEPKTQRALVKLAGSIKFISAERIRDEFIKILASERPAEGILLLYKTKLLQYIIPELEQGVNVKQGRHHIHPVFKHNVLALKNCSNPAWQVRFAALLHDVGKPKTKKIINNISTFYNHEYLGAKMTDKIMRRLKFSTIDRERVVNLVKNHMFYYNVDEVTAASVRRLIVKVGKENLQDLIDLRVADRLGSGDLKPMPYKLRHLQYMLDKVQHDPVSVKMLKINGHDLMTRLKISPGPKIGAILDILLAQVIEDPDLNQKDLLMVAAEKLAQQDLFDLRNQAQELITEKQIADDKKIKKQYHIY